MKWQKEPPSVEGWYWVRSERLNGIFRVVPADDFFEPGVPCDGLWLVATPHEECDSCGETISGAVPVARKGYEWSGPIPEPEEGEE